MINTTIGKYKIIRLIGEGGMAAVYEAEHEILGTRVAIKVLNPILSANAQIKERFRNEAKVMASLEHSNITKVIDFDEQPQQLSIVMEFLKGEDLNQRIKRKGPLSEKEISEVFSQTLKAFQYAHDKGIVHRDIKPSNIFILNDGHVKILDFGIAKLFGQNNEMTQTGTQMGTPIYMSPEQVKADKTIDYRSDIYSIGVTMYFAVNGKPPYNPTTHSQFDIFNKIVYEPLHEFSVQSRFNDMILIACQKNREERFENCNTWLSKVINLETNNPKPIDETKTEYTNRLSEDATRIYTSQSHNYSEKPSIEFSQNNPESESSSKNSLKENLDHGKSTKKPIIKIATLAFLSTIVLGVSAYFAFNYYKNNQLEKAIEFVKNENYEKAFNILNSSILEENSEAQYYLAKMYKQGHYVEINLEKAFELAKKSAEQGNDKGLNFLGTCYNDGLGTYKDIKKALDYYTKASELGNAKAYNNLGNLYFRGDEGITKDYVKANEYYLKSINLAKDQIAVELEGRPEVNIGQIHLYGGYGVTIDYGKAKEYFLLAKDKNNALASERLGEMYDYGLGVGEDNYQAFKYYTISANLNNSDAQDRLGNLYFFGAGCEQDDFKAFELFKKSADQKNANGLADLGYMHQYGRGGAEKNLNKARMYYNEAAELGNEWAKTQLEFL